MTRGALVRLILILIVIGVAVTWGYWTGLVESGTTQPIQFPHKTHLDLKLACTTCHYRAEKEAVAGRPPTALCLGCHMGGDTQSQEIKKLRAFGETGREIPWRRVWRLPSHVYFPHRVHVTVAKVECQTCHGPMESLTRPPEAPLKILAMDDCIACHEKLKSPEGGGKAAAEATKMAARRISLDCITCHR